MSLQEIFYNTIMWVRKLIFIFIFFFLKAHFSQDAYFLQDVFIFAFWFLFGLSACGAMMHFMSKSVVILKMLHVLCTNSCLA